MYILRITYKKWNKQYEWEKHQQQRQAIQDPINIGEGERSHGDHIRITIIWQNGWDTSLSTWCP